MDLSSFPCSYYEGDDWLKIDMHELLAPWVARATEIYGIKKKPAKYLVSYAFMFLANHNQDAIQHIALEAFENNEELQVGSRLIPTPPNVEVLSNPKGIRPPNPRNLNFMDIVDYWAKAITPQFGIGIVQCRDVVKIVFTSTVQGPADRSAGPCTCRSGPSPRASPLGRPPMHADQRWESKRCVRLPHG